MSYSSIDERNGVEFDDYKNETSSTNHKRHRSSRSSSVHSLRSHPHKAHKDDDYSQSILSRSVDSRDRDESSHSHSSNSSDYNDHDDDIGHIEFKMNDTFKSRYVAKSEMGLGTFGKVFKCKDLKHNDYVAIKVIRKIEKYIESAQIERDILNDIYEEQKRQKKNYCVKLFSTFTFNCHFFMVFEPLGMSLFSLVKLNDYVGLPLNIVKIVAQQMLQGIEFLHSMNLIHTDLKLENILFKSITSVHQLQQITVYSPRKKKQVKIYVPPLMSSSLPFEIKLIDFGGATYDDEHKTTIINTRQYRSPEVTLEIGWSFPSDLWCTGCILAEILNGELLFATHDNLEHFALMEQMIGYFPRDMVELSPVRHKYFTDISAGSPKVKFAQLSKDSQDYVNSLPFNIHKSKSSSNTSSSIRIGGSGSSSRGSRDGRSISASTSSSSASSRSSASNSCTSTCGGLEALLEAYCPIIAVAATHTASYSVRNTIEGGSGKMIAHTAEIVELSEEGKQEKQLSTVAAAESLERNGSIGGISNFTRLMKGLLRLDPLDRYSAKKALKSSFFDLLV